MTRLMTRPARVFVVSLVAAFVADPLSAAPVSPGTVEFLSGTTVAAEPQLAGTVVLDNILPFEIHDNLGNLVVTGNVQERVVRSSVTNRLIYAPRIRDVVAPGGEAWVMAMDYKGFAGVPTDIEYRLDGLGQVGPNSISRSSDGDNLRFRYDPNLILSPSESRFLSINTPALQSVPMGGLTIYAQNDFGASVFSTSLRDVAVPAFPGDANLDGRFDSVDLVQVFSHNEYNDNLTGNSSWREGDWNNDSEFDSADIVLALRAGRFDTGKVAAQAGVRSVPEPGTFIALAIGFIGLLSAGRRNEVVVERPRS